MPRKARGAPYWPLLVASLAPLAAAADVIAGRPTQLALTFYRSPERIAGALQLDRLAGFALIRETRALSLPAGRSRILFENVADGIEPSSVLITGLPEGVLEKNRDERLLGPEALVRAALGRPVELIRTNEKTGRRVRIPAVIRSDAGDGVVFQTADGIEALRCSGLPETFAFSGVGELRATPTLSALVHVEKPTTTSVTLSYLARGFDWSATYQATLSPDGRSMSLGAWVTLANENAVSFRDASAQLVAGRLNRESGAVEPLDLGQPILARCWPRGSTSDSVTVPSIARAVPLLNEGDTVEVGVAQFGRAMTSIMSLPAPTAAALVREEQLGDLKLYRVPMRTSVASRQMKQVRLLDRAAVPVEVVYASDLPADGEVDAVPTRRFARTRNDAAHGLGLALPSGRIAAYMPTNGVPLLVEEAPLRDTAEAEELLIGLGISTDVRISARHEATSEPLTRVSPAPKPTPRGTAAPNVVDRVEIRNASATGISFELRLTMPANEALIDADPVPSMLTGRPVFKLTVAPGSVAMVRYRTVRPAVPAPVASAPGSTT